MAVLSSLILVLLSPETERLLLGPSPFFRAEGMERALREGDHELLLRASKSPHWDARRLAAIALGRNTPPRLLEDPVAVVREAAVRSLDRRAPAEGVIALLKDKDDAVRAAAAWALRGTDARRPLQALLRDPAPSVRFAALAATGNFARLRTLAAKDDLAVAVPALVALGGAGGPSEAAFGLARLKRALALAAKMRIPVYEQPVPRSDLALARAVGDMARRDLQPGGRDLRELLLKLVRGTPLHSPAALLLAEVIAGAHDAEAARLLLDAQLRARSRSTLPSARLDPGLRAVLHTFSREPWPELAPLLLPFRNHRSVSVRLAVAEALVGNAARPALHDADPRVRAVACGRVGRLKPLIGMLKDPDALVLIACARALGRLGDARAAPTLEPLLSHRKYHVRRAAVGALLRLAHPERAAALYRVAIHDVHPAVRATAAEVLAFLDEDETVLPRAIEALGDKRLAVRENAIALIRVLTEARLGYSPAQPMEGRASWSAWWRKKTERRRPPDAFSYHVEDLRRKGIDLVLVLDATGSMAPVIQSTKRRIVTVMEGLRRVVPDLRARIVAYRDRGDVFLTLGSPLTHDARVLEDFLACISASGGDDPQEAVLAGLREAIARTKWRPASHRVVLLFGDAPPHDRDLTLLEAILKEFSGAVHGVDVGGYGRGGSKYALDAFRKIAQWGGGSAIHIADEGDLLRNILVLTLGARYRTAVEALFGL
ncbi:MAG: HEAT repeat domain-containing protein [Planctomycetota bacterium]|jgi:HEAT repeat protein